MKKGYIIFSLIFLISTSNLLSITWTKVYGDSLEDIAYSVKQTPDGGYVVIGRKQLAFGEYSVWILKLDEYGDTLWTRTYDSISYSNSRHDIEVDYDSGFIFIGSIKNIVTPYIDIFVIKTDVNGDSLWSKAFSINQFAFPYDIDKTSDSCYVIVGDAIYGNANGFILKIDNYGDSLWASLCGEEFHFWSVSETNDKCFITTASAFIFKTVYKYDSLGNCIDSRNLSNTWALDIEQLLDSNLIVINSTSKIFKIDNNLDTIYTINKWGLDATPTEDGGFIVTGWNGDLYLVKYNTNGDSLWSVMYGGSGGDYGNSIEQTTDKGYIIAGATNSYGAGGSDFYIIKTDSLGYALGIEEEVINNNPESFNISYISKENGNVQFNFTLSQSEYVELEIFDLSGRLISTPVNDNFQEGDHEINISLPNSGVYIYRFNSSVYEQSGLPAIVAGKLIVF